MKKKVNIEGMTCEHCKHHVEEALKEVCGIKTAEVSLEGKFADIELAHDVDDEDIEAAVKESGYQVTSIQ